MRLSYIKKLFATFVTTLGCSLISVGNQSAHGSNCPTQDCESCVFCSLATPACLDPCQTNCSKKVSATGAEEDPSILSVSSAADSEVMDISNEGIEPQGREQSCPVAFDLMNADPTSSSE